MVLCLNQSKIIIACTRMFLRCRWANSPLLFFRSNQSMFQANNAFQEQQDPSKSKFFKRLQLDESPLTPQKLVEYLDRFVIGQGKAKKAVACAFRNRWRRRDLNDDFKQQIIPKNLLIKGPTGSGKTELARRLAKLTNSPFLRVEATKYTEVGYVGKDVNSIVQDLAKIGINSYRTRLDKTLKTLSQTVQEQVYLQILDAMVGDSLPPQLREKKLADLKNGHYNDQIITVMPGYRPDLDLEEGHYPQKPITKTVREVGNYLYTVYYQRIKSIYTNVDVQKEAIKHVEEDGIIFLDEIDKLAVPEGPISNVGKGVSTEGVQRDLLPLIEGTTVSTKFGDVKTDHILFIASGSFSMAKVEDLIPQLLGRLPIRVSLEPISRSELVRILKQPDYNLISQQCKLMEAEGLKLVFSESGIQQLAEIAYQMNTHMENLGARRLHAVIEKVIEDISFEAPDKKGSEIIIDGQYVRAKMKGEFKEMDLTRYLI